MDTLPVFLLRLHIGKAIDTGNDLGRVLAQSVQDYPQRLLTGLVCVLHNANGPLRRSKGLMAGQERKALRLIPQQHSSQISVAQAHLPVIGHGTGNAEGLQPNSNRLRRFGCCLTAFLDGDGRPHNVCPAGVFKGNGLDFLHDLIGINTLAPAQLPCFLQ